MYELIYLWTFRSLALALTFVLALSLARVRAFALSRSYLSPRGHPPVNSKCLQILVLKKRGSFAAGPPWLLELACEYVGSFGVDILKRKSSVSRPLSGLVKDNCTDGLYICACQFTYFIFTYLHVQFFSIRSMNSRIIVSHYTCIPC